MVSITLKNIPKKLHERLKKQAKEHRRSLSGEILAHLETIPAQDGPDPKVIIQRARALRKGIKGHLTDDLLREFKENGRK